MITDTENELSNVVAFTKKKEDLRDEMALRMEDSKSVRCHHDAVWVNEKERTIRCRKCDSLIEPFNYLLTLCETESRYIENVKYLRREEQQRRQNIEKLIQIEKNAKARIRKSGVKGDLPSWQLQKVNS